MQLDKAIEILTIHNDHNPNFTDEQRREAHHLGIEALIHLKKQRRFNLAFKYELLPGEIAPEPTRPPHSPTGVPQR